jgi:hypothetical protein
VILRRILAAAIPFAGVVGVVTACSGVPEIKYGDGGDNGTPDGTVGPDGNLPDGTTTDAPRDVTVDPNCVKSSNTELNCEDGQDNDCDGLYDCEDPDCNPTHQCVDKAPTGFELLAVSDVRTTACPGGFLEQADNEMLIGSNPSCACKCTDEGGTCTGGTVDVTSGTEATCTTNPQTRALNRTAANCTAIPSGGLPIGGNNARYEASVAATAPTSCTVGSTLSLPTTISGRTCKPPTSSNGAGCAPTQVCVRKPSAGYQYCATRPSPDAGVPASCAAPYLTRRRAGTTLTGTPTCDETGCSCNNGACTGTVSIFESAACTVGGAGGRTEDITTGATGTACTAMTMVSGNAFTALAYKAVSTGGCAPAGTSAVVGDLTLTNETTICCKQ